MAGYTSRPRGGGLSRFASAPSYAGVAARYASDFTAALNEQKQNDLKARLISYQNGSLTYDDLRKYIEDQIKTEGESSSWGLTLQQNLLTLKSAEEERVKNKKRAELTAKATEAPGGLTADKQFEIEKEMLTYEKPGTDSYNNQQQNVIKAYNNAQEEKVANKQAELYKLYGAGGLTDSEQLAINLELQAIADPNSDVYRKLVSQEATIRTQLASSSSSQNAKVGREDLDFRLGEIDSNVKRIDELYAQGSLTGLQRDTALAEEFQNASEAIGAAKASGANISKEEYANYMFGSRYFQENLKKRQVGEILDVEDKSGKVVPVTIEQLKADAQSSNPKYTNSFNSFTFTNLGGQVAVVDKTTNEFLKDKSGNPFLFSNLKDARNELARLYSPDTFEVKALGANGQRQYWNFNKNANAFIEQGGTTYYKSIPQTQDEAKKYMLTPETTKAKTVKSPGEYSGPVMKPSFGDWVKDTAKVLPGVGPIVQGIDLVNKATSGGVDNFIGGLNPIKTAQAAEPGFKVDPKVNQFNFEMPQFQLPSFDFSNVKIPSFDMPKFTSGGSSPMQTTQAKTQNMQNSAWYQPIIDTISSGISSVRNFLKI